MEFCGDACREERSLDSFHRTCPLSEAASFGLRRARRGKDSPLLAEMTDQDLLLDALARLLLSPDRRP